jgi:hypothetical protein
MVNHTLEEHREDLWPTAGNGLHPQSHYWPMHLVETGIVLGVAVVATGAAFFALRRRTG